MNFGSSLGIFLNSANLICPSTDILKCFRGSLWLLDNESGLYLGLYIFLNFADVNFVVCFFMTLKLGSFNGCCTHDLMFTVLL